MPAASAESQRLTTAHRVGVARSDDTALVQAARRGDRAAFASLHAQFAPMVHGIALARTPVAYANDLVQETFLHALDRLPQLRDDTAFGPWLATIARNLAVEFHRRRARAHEALPEDLVQPARSSPSSEFARACQLLAAIRTLPDSYSETLVLRLVEGLTGPQIAACTGLTHGSVRVNLARGMAMLRERLQELNIRPEASP